MPKPLVCTRAQILGYRQLVGALDARLPFGPASLRTAAWAGLQDSMPRAALLSIHARVARTQPLTWEDASLVQLWGPRFSAYMVAALDRAVFTMGRLPDSPQGRARATELADRIGDFLGRRRVAFAEAARGIGEKSHNRLRYAAPSGRILMRWDGARQPAIWTVPAPKVSPQEMRLELARRYVHTFGPTTPHSFATWAGLPRSSGDRVFDALGSSLASVRTPIGDAWILVEDVPSLRAARAMGSSAGVRLLPSGDNYFLLQGADRKLLLPSAHHRRALWTSRVWPGAILVGTEIVGVWRRASNNVRLLPWTRVSRSLRKAIEKEAESLPIPDLDRAITASWED